MAARPLTVEDLARDPVHVGSGAFGQFQAVIVAEFLERDQELRAREHRRSGDRGVVLGAVADFGVEVHALFFERGSEALGKREPSMKSARPSRRTHTRDDEIAGTVTSTPFSETSKRPVPGRMPSTTARGVPTTVRRDWSKGTALSWPIRRYTRCPVRR